MFWYPLIMLHIITYVHKYIEVSITTMILLHTHCKLIIIIIMCRGTYTYVGTYNMIEYLLPTMFAEKFCCVSKLPYKNRILRI